MKLSVVTTMYKSAPFIDEFYRRVTAAATAIADEYEIILVNDGSPDDSLDVACQLARRDPRIIVVDLSRNFGHHHAVVAGLSHCNGDRVFLLDIDLEESPEWLSNFWRELEHCGADVVFGVLETRQGSAFKRLTGSLFYRMFNLLSETKLPINPCTVRLMTRRYVDALLTLQDKSLFLAGNFAWTGFDQRAIAVNKTIRKSGSTYSLVRMMRLFVNAVTSFTGYPLQAMFVLGLMITIVAAGFGAVLAIRKLLTPETVQMGWSSVMVSVWLIGGFIICSLGIIGLYLSRVFVEIKPRPAFIVRAVIRSNVVGAGGD